MWEIPALAVLMELRSRAVTKGMGKFELQVLYARAMTRVWEKIGRLKQLPDLRIADFGTRRRHGFLWQDWCVQAMIEGLGPSFLGTSNCLIAMRREVEAIGTNAHELPMVYAALADNDAELAEAPYRVLADWQQDYDGNLRVMLPDTYGTRTSWSGPPTGSPTGPASASTPGPDRGRRDGHRLVARARAGPAREARDLLRRTGCGRRSSASTEHFHGRVRIGYGWGTLLTNDFRGLAPDGRARSLLHRLQGHLRRRPPGGEALRQSDQGDGTARGGRALPARVPRRRAGGAARAGLIEQPRHGAPHMQQAMRVDLNCDMGEGFGPWPMGDDAGDARHRHLGQHRVRLPCGRSRHHGAHRRLAKEKGVAIGAHPGFNDLWGFGRRCNPGRQLRIAWSAWWRIRSAPCRAWRLWPGTRSPM